MIYLVRHGATDANLSDPPILQGQGLDIPLNQHGISQAASTARVLENVSFSQVISSPLRRAQQTAQIITNSQQELRIVAEITECDVGEWERLSWIDIKERFPEEHDQFMADPAENGYRGGESFGDVHRRAIAAIELFNSTLAHDNILIVTHNVVARVTIAHYLGVPISKSRMVHLDNCGISILEPSDGNFRVRTVNSHLHLPPIEA